MKLKFLPCLLFIIFLLTGCSVFPAEEQEDTWTDSGYVTVGHHLTIKNSGNGLSLLNNMDVLSADGLYYAAFTIGDFEPYENSDGDTVNLYDAQFYLVLGEYSNSTNAQNNMNKWLTAAKENYQILSEEEITCNGQPYLLITYRFINEENPYDRGISAFGVSENSAVCLELTCRENFENDLRTLMMDFLDNCTFNAD